jgi:hypothetical protein
MNIIRNIEGATLLTIGIFCAAAVTNIVLHSAQVLPDDRSSIAASAIPLPAVAIIGKRLSRTEKVNLVNQDVGGCLKISFSSSCLP